MRRSSLERSKHGRNNDGAIPQVEDITSLDDDYDVNIRLAGSGVVYAPTRSDKRTSRSGECRHGGHARCICGVART